MRQQPLHVPWADRHTSGRRLVARLDQMEKDRRTAMAFARRDVPVHHQADIVKPVRPFHLLVAWLERRLHQPVIRSVLGLVAPQHFPFDPFHRKRRLRQPDPFAADEPVDEPHRRNRRGAIAFPLEGGHPGTTDRRLQSDSLERDNRPSPVARCRPDRQNRLFF